MAEFPHYLDRLTPEEMETLRPLTERIQLPPGAVLFIQGDRPEHLFIVHHGSVKMSRASEVGRDIILELLFPGDVCGALCALDDEPYGMSAVCLQEVDVSKVPRAEFMEASRRLPGLLTKAVDVCRLKTRQQREMMTGMALERAEQRAARALLVLAARLGARAVNGVRLPMILSRTEFSEMIGTTVETAIRVLSRLRKDGMVEERDGEMVILDEPALRELAGL